jgi:DNA repair photolyase
MKNTSNKSQVGQTIFNAARSGTGTREWAKHSYNICTGCAHKCHYCYAMFRARRFGDIADITDWSRMSVDQEKVAGAAKYFDDGVMFPTTHDITPEILRACLQTLENMLSHGSAVLVVSKPHLSVIQTLCRELPRYRDQIQFRFTIGSLLPATCAIWEPGAPAPSERIAALKHALKRGFRTSVSMEPMLGDNSEMRQLVATVEPFVSDTIWLGKLNRGVTSRGLTEQDALKLTAAKQALRKAQSDENILALVAALKDNPKVRWKDSIKSVLASADNLNGV